MNESRVKCELLEQSLRVLAQENHDMETKTLHHDKHTSGHTSHHNEEMTNAEVHNLSIEEKMVTQRYKGKDGSDDESEEFFDIGKKYKF